MRAFRNRRRERTAYAEMVGCDGYALFAALYSATAPPWLRELPAVETLRRVWLQNFLPLYEGGARWRDKADLPPGAQYINSPYDPEAHYAKKRAHTWLGYKVHLTEACDDDLPHLITNVHTTAAPTGDNDALPGNAHRTSPSRTVAEHPSGGHGLCRSQTAASRVGRRMA